MHLGYFGLMGYRERGKRPQEVFREHILACGPMYAGPFDVQAMAWFLHLHSEQIEIFPFPPGSLITGPTRALAVDPRFPAIGRTPQWVIRSSCPPAS